MHYTGTIWRPPYETDSQLLQITSGCTHNKCSFCSLYHGLQFRMSPISEIEEDLIEIRSCAPAARKVFLTGANPFVLCFDQLKEIALKVKKYLVNCEEISTFSRIEDIKTKTEEQLKELRSLGFNGLSIGTESGDDKILRMINKGNTSAETIEQCKKLEDAKIRYYTVYMVGLAGAGNGQSNAVKSAEMFNQLSPDIISLTYLTLFPGSKLYKEVKNGAYNLSTEIERLYELKTFIASLQIKTRLLANTVSNPILMEGNMPEDQEDMIRKLQYAIDHVDENTIQDFRRSIKSL